MTMIRTAPKRRARNLVLAVVVLMAIGGGMFLWLAHSSELVVCRLVLPATTNTSPERIKREIAGVMGQNLLKLSLRPFEEKLRAIPYVREARLHKRFPDAVEVRLVEYQPFALVSDAAGKVWMVSDDGRVLEPWRQSDVLAGCPIIVSTPPVSLETGERLPPMFASALKLVGYLEQRAFWVSDHPVAKVLVDPESSLTAVLSGGAEIRLGDASELERKLDVAEEVVRRWLAGGGTLQYVDVRVWSRPVVLPRTE